MLLLINKYLPPLFRILFFFLTYLFSTLLRGSNRSLTSSYGRTHNFNFQTNTSNFQTNILLVFKQIFFLQIFFEQIFSYSPRKSGRCMGPSMTDVSRSMRQQMEENDHSKRKTKQVFFDDMSLIGGEIANIILICFCI